jgi:hypothetical protein
MTQLNLVDIELVTTGFSCGVSVVYGQVKRSFAAKKLAITAGSVVKNMAS